MTHRFTVYGHPQPQGSTKSFRIPGTERIVTTSDNPKLKAWRHDVSAIAFQEIGSAGIIRKPVAAFLRVTFVFAPPKHLPKGRTWPSTRPDADKILRGIFDALSGIAVEDDAQFSMVEVRKIYGLPERSEIEISALELGPECLNIPLLEGIPDGKEKREVAAQAGSEAAKTGSSARRPGLQDRSARRRRDAIRPRP